MVSEYIDREAAIQAASIWNGDESTEAWIKSALKKLPAADVVERRHGKWIVNGCDATCSVCHSIFVGDWYDLDLIEDCEMNYCAACGADMRQEEAE